MGLQQQQNESHDTVDFAGYHQSNHNRRICGLLPERQQIQNANMSPKDFNTSFPSTKGLLNGPGQNNCFLNSAVQVRNTTYFY